jgi:hypothetical protein
MTWNNMTLLTHSNSKSKFLAIVDLELPASGLRLFEQLWDTKTVGDLKDQQIIDDLLIIDDQQMEHQTCKGRTTVCKST